MDVNFDEFRRQALAQELIYATAEEAVEHRRHFLFELKRGTLFAPATAKNTLKLIQLARTFGVSEGFGEHNELLSLAVERPKLVGSRAIRWQWRERFTPRPLQEGWVRLGDWLAEKHQPYLPSQRQFSLEVKGTTLTTNVSEQTYNAFMDGLELRQAFVDEVLSRVVRLYDALTEETINKYMDEQWTF